jgi:hypothetical protein
MEISRPREFKDGKITDGHEGSFLCEVRERHILSRKSAR